MYMYHFARQQENMDECIRCAFLISENHIAQLVYAFWVRFQTALRMTIIICKCHKCHRTYIFHWFYLWNRLRLPSAFAAFSRKTGQVSIHGVNAYGCMYINLYSRESTSVIIEDSMCNESIGIHGYMRTMINLSVYSLPFQHIHHLK